MSIYVSFHEFMSSYEATDDDKLKQLVQTTVCVAGKSNFVKH